MNTNENPTGPVAVKIFGVGNAGGNIIEPLIAASVPGVKIAAVNTDGQSLISSGAPEKIALEMKTLRGLGTGGDPERGRSAANEHLAKLKESCSGVEVVFVVAGLGGGAGTGVAPVLARAAKEAGALVLAFVTLPFDCEGNRRRQQALHGLQELKAAADGVICLPNQKLFKLIDENTSVVDTFKLSNELLAGGVMNVWRLMARKGLIEIHFAELCQLLRDRHGESAFATAEASGPTRSREAVDKILAHPMLDGGKMLSDSEAVLVSLIGGPDLTMAEVNRVMEHINSKCSRAQIIMGAAIDDEFKERLAVTIVATRKAETLAARAGFNEIEHSRASMESPQVPEDLHMIDHGKSSRPNSRFVPPPPPVSPEQMEELRGKQGGGRQRGKSPRLRQTQLPLEIVSKGRFDKSEPTIHKGEDLDVPTYIRRGVSLN